jgi:hypothetical protein
LIGRARWARLLLLAGCATGMRESTAIPGSATSAAGCDPEVLWSAAQARFETESWTEAVGMAERAERCGLDPARSRDLKAASLLLSGRAGAALDVWEEPTAMIVARVRTAGVARTSAAAVRRRSGLAPGDRLTGNAYRLAERRLADLPAVASAAVRITPSRSRRATVELAVAERPTFVRLPWELVVRAGAAVARETAELTWNSPFGSGGALSTLVRWQGGRRAWSIRAAGIPSPLPFRIDVRATISEESFVGGGSGGPATATRSERRDVGVRIGDWVTSGLFVAFDAGRERWGGDLRTDAWRIGTRAELRSADDRMRLGATLGTALAGGQDFHTAAIDAALRSSRSFDPGHWRYSIEAGFARVSQNAPLPLWPGAGAGRARRPLLRAHGLLDGGAIRVDRAFGRSLAHGSVEVGSPARPVAGLWITAAAFTDLARSSRRADRLAAFTAWDVGVGLRIRTLFDVTGRIDAAIGLLDASRTVSVGLVRQWDPWR